MPDQDFVYDVFLSHASEDAAWCERLAERLRDAGVRVWFDQWRLKPGDNMMARINEGLETSRKMVAVWSANYFRHDKVWTMVESFNQIHPDPLANERLLIPIQIEDSQIPALFRSYLTLDFRKQDDFELRFRQLIEALDIPKQEFADDDDLRLHEYELDKLDKSERGRRNYKRGKRFEDEIATLYRLLGFDVKPDVQINGVQIDLMIEKDEGGFLTQAIVECKDKRIASTERDQILAQQNIIQKSNPRIRWVAVSSQGFAAETRAALDSAGIDCTTYANLLRKLVPLEEYAAGLVTNYQRWRCYLTGGSIAAARKLCAICATPKPARSIPTKPKTWSKSSIRRKRCGRCWRSTTRNNRSLHSPSVISLHPSPLTA